jgi:replication-associated recombination protein RarA
MRKVPSFLTSAILDVAPFFAKASKADTTSTHTLAESAPLAERLRPRTLADFVGQEHLTGDDSLLLSIVESKAIGSMILWGPPGLVFVIRV